MSKFSLYFSGSCTPINKNLLLSQNKKVQQKRNSSRFPYCFTSTKILTRSRHLASTTGSGSTVKQDGGLLSASLSSKLSNS